MGKIKASYVTDKGKQMLFSGGTVNYTKAVLYSQDVSNLAVSDLRQLTSLTGELMTTPVGVIDRQSGATSSVNVEAVFTNAGLDHDITFGSVGWFAKQGDDGDEILMAVEVANAGANLAASPPGGKATDAVDLTLSFAIGDATTVDAVIAPAASITPAQFNSAVNELHTALDTKADESQLPDLTPYAKTVDVDASLDTKADKQTVADDLAKKADQSDVNEKLATKADKDGVDEALSKKADKTDLDPLAKTEDVNTELDKKADKTALDDYAKSSDVAADVQQLNDAIDTKADAKTVNDAIDKIDFSPYAKTVDVQAKLDTKANTTDLAPFARSVDVNKQIEGISTAVTNASNTEQADIDKINKALATKRDITDSYSKDQLDKKFLELSTDTGGKVDASQVATMIENKADKSDVTKQIGTVTDLVNTKANSTDVTAALDKKDDITDVDAKIKKVTDLANTKANVSDIYNRSAIDTAFSQRDSKITNLQNSALQVIEGHAGDDILSFRDDKVRVYNNCQDVKNLPPMGNIYWFYVIVHTSCGWGSVTVISQDNCYWQNVLNGDTWAGWTKHATSADIDHLTNTINQKANSSDVYSKKDVDSLTTGTVTNKFDIAGRSHNTLTDERLKDHTLVDSNVLYTIADQINQLKGRRTIDTPDFNSLTDGGNYYITNPYGGKNSPTGSWGNLFVSNGNGHRISQLYFPDDGSAPWTRLLDETTWHNWMQLSTKQDVQNAVNLANASSNKVDTVLANSYFRKQGMDANGNCVEIRGNATKQSNGGYAFDIRPNDWTASKLKDVLGQLPSKANTADVNNALNDKANAGDVSALQNKVNVNTPLFREISADSTWEDIFGVTNPNNVLTSLRINPGGSGQLVNDFAAGIGFGGNDTKAVITVDYGSHVARFTAGNGTAPGWSEDVAWKSDVNSVNATVSALQQTVKALNDTISSANATIKTLQDTITGLQTQVSNQANEISYIKANYIEGKRFAKADESQATAWEKENSQRIAFITDN